MTKRRVVITGIGAMTPYGYGADVFWKNMIETKSCISKTEGLSDTNTVFISGQIKDFNPDLYMDPKDAKRMDRNCQLAIAASNNAIEDSGILNAGYDPYRVGVIMGTAAGGFITLSNVHSQQLNRGATKCSPFAVPMMIANIASGRLSIKYGFKGVNKAVLSACATGTHSIGDAFRTIQYGDADAMLAGGCDATICDLGVGSFTAARALSKRNDNPEKASRPYDKDRDGFVMSEGAAALILEEYESAKKRGAKIYAEIIGYGQSADAYDIVAPAPDGASVQVAMELALKDASINATDVDYINTHATSTHVGDIIESKAVEKVFGDKNTNKNLYVTSTKGLHGHMMGATGALECIVCIKTITDDVIIPTVNLDNQDEEVGNLNYVPNKPIKTNVKIALNNSFGFGGHNATLIFKEVE